VFIAEVFFVNVREQAGIKFGGPIGNVEDPKSGVPVETLVHGEFSFRVTGPEQLIIGLVGMGRSGSDIVDAWMKEQVLKVVRDRAAELLVKNKWPLLDVTSGAYTEEIETDVLKGLGTHVASYGVEIVRLGNFVIAIDETDAANLKRLYTDTAYVKSMGGVGNYQQFAAGKAMLGAGEGMSKGGGGSDGSGGAGGAGLMGGAGLGVGMAMAQMLVKDNRGGTSLAPVAAGVVCKACNATVAPGKFCASCGKSLESTSAASGFCVGCGAAMGPDAKFCGACGKPRP
jgi:membrane protease subunit (stomatin/prohibitin family)